MVAPRAKTLLAADGDLLVVKQVAKELPARRHFVALKTLFLGHQVHRSGSGHRPCQTVDAVLLEPRNELGVVCNYSQTVTGRNKSVGTVNHVAVSVAIAGGSKVDSILVHGFDELMRVD